MPEPKTYTFTYDEIARLIIIPTIFKYNRCIMKVRTLIDTGAAASYITKFVTDSLKIPTTGKIYRVQFAEKSANRQSVKADMILSSEISFCDKEFTVLEDEPRTYDAIIGMDILTQTDFSISNFDNHTMFTLRIPSVEEIKYGGDTTQQDVELLMDRFENTFLST